MEISVIINVGAVAVSLSAMIVSALLARRQFSVQRHGNHVDPLIELLKEFRSLEFHQNYEFIRSTLPRLSSDHGISGLDEAVQKKIYDIGYFFQLYAILAYLDIIDERFIGALLHRRYVETWSSMKPFVHKERELQGLHDGAILNFFEDFADQLSRRPPEEMQRMLARRRAGGRTH